MIVIKALHILCVFVWIGNLLALTRLMGYHVKEDDHTQMQMAKIYKRMYNLVELPTMVVALFTGVVLMINRPLIGDPTWFYLKLLFVGGLVVCDVFCGRFVGELNLHPDHTRGIKYKILHGMAGLMLIGVITSIYVIHDKKTPAPAEVTKPIVKFQEKQLAKIG